MRKLLSALLLGSVAAAPSQRAPDPTPTFNVGTKLVEVDVVARNKNGPATGLTREDFTVFDNGVPQDIAFFTARSARTSATTQPASIVSPLPPGVVSNRANPKGEAPATQTVLLLDRFFTNPINQGFAINRIAKFLDLRRKQDGIGIYTLTNSLRVIQEVTDNDTLLRRAAKSLKAGNPVNLGHSDTTGMSEHAAAEYLNPNFPIIMFKHTLQSIARHLANVPGRKNLIWISEAFPIFYCMPHLPCVDYTPDMQEAARALNDANVALYAVDPRGLEGALGRMTGISNAEGRGPASQSVPGYRVAPVGPTHIETMNFLAGLTGGSVYFNDNGIEDLIKTVVEDGDVTYSLSFYPSQAAQDGKVHPLKVNVARAGVNLRYRKNYFATKPQSPGDIPTLQQLLGDPLDATQISLQAQATRDPARAGFFNVRIAVDLHGVQLANQDGKWIGSLEVSLHIENSSSSQVLPYTIEIPADQLATALEQGVVIDHSIEWPSKSGDLRIVVEDKTSGAAGSLRIPLGKNQ